MDYLKTISDSFTGYFNYLVNEITHPGWHNYFYLLLALSLIVWLGEIVFPWRRQQPIIRKDFWLDGFYMFFNFFLFSLVGYNALSNVAVDFFNNALTKVGITNVVALEISAAPVWLQFLIMFLVADFISWCVHILLHRVPFLWKFHKVHHSVQQMGFAAHLRYHWMETIVYNTILYLPLAMIGFSIQDWFVLHAFTILIGHLNHANMRIDYGPFRYIFNNPAMHIWHHAKTMPPDHKYGVNFGISLSVWDYLFKTAYMPSSGRDIPLGFEDVESYPEGFIGQTIEPFKSTQDPEQDQA